MSEIDTIVGTLIESEDDTTVKDVSDVGIRSLEDWLERAGFRPEEKSWVKRLGNKAVVVTAVPGGFYASSDYKRGETGWFFAGNRYISGPAGMIDHLQSVANLPVVEAEEAEDWKQIYDTSGLETIREYMRSKILYLRGNVERTNHHYVHERTTDCNIQDEWIWPDNYTDQECAEIEERVGTLINSLQKRIEEQMVNWNHKIYRELEQAYDAELEDGTVAENIIANEWMFDEEGNHDEDGPLTYQQLDDEGQETARGEWREAEAQSTDIYWSESVIAEWKWLLKNRGFNDVEIAFSGFSSQGDGASFTAKSIDFERYFSGPDPLTFPEAQRDQLSESEEDEGILKEIGMPSQVDVFLRWNYDEYDRRNKWAEYTADWSKAGPFVSASSAQEWAISNLKDYREKITNMEIYVVQRHSGVGSLRGQLTLDRYYVDQDFQLRKRGKTIHEPMGEAQEEFEVKELMPQVQWYSNYHYPIWRKTRFNMGLPRYHNFGTVDIIHSLPGQSAKRVAAKDWKTSDLGENPNAELRRRGRILLRAFRKAAKQFGDDDLKNHMNAWDWLKAHGVDIDAMTAKAEGRKKPSPVTETDEGDFDMKEVSEPPQRWMYKIHEWPTCKSINYFVIDDPKYRYVPGVLDEPLQKTVGGHTFSKRTKYTDLRLIAQAQIRQFKKAGRYNDDQWDNVWEWLKAVRAQEKPKE